MQFFIPFSKWNVQLLKIIPSILDSSKKAMLEYRQLKNGKILGMFHTEVPTELHGQGIAAKLCKVGDAVINQNMDLGGIQVLPWEWVEGCD